MEDWNTNNKVDSTIYRRIPLFQMIPYGGIYVEENLEEEMMEI